MNHTSEFVPLEVKELGICASAGLSVVTVTLMEEPGEQA